MRKIEKYWQSYLEKLHPDSPERKKSYVAEQFGDNPELAEYLGELIRTGKKTATCSALWELEANNLPVPEVGLLTIVLDGRDQPLCIIETTEVSIKSFNKVEAKFAYDEGEGDRSLEYWRRAHWDYFTRVLAKIGKKPTPEMPLVCERFRVIYDAGE